MRQRPERYYPVNQSDTPVRRSQIRVARLDGQPFRSAVASFRKIRATLILKAPILLPGVLQSAGERRLLKDGWFCAISGACREPKLTYCGMPAENWRKECPGEFRRGRSAHLPPKQMRPYLVVYPCTTAVEKVRSPNTTTWSRHSRRIEPISLQRMRFATGTRRCWVGRECPSIEVCG
jgi:hypothetical protein